jgi:hypothetical protein
VAREVGVSSQVASNFDRTGLKNELKEIGLNKNVLQQSDHRLEQVLRATDLLLESCSKAEASA